MSVSSSSVSDLVESSLKSDLLGELEEMETLLQTVKGEAGPSWGASSSTKSSSKKSCHEKNFRAFCTCPRWTCNSITH